MPWVYSLERGLLIVGIGTGMELSYLPRYTLGVGVDLSGRMMESLEWTVSTRFTCP
jgi:hypothetical protein